MSKSYDDLNLLYTFDPESPKDLCTILANNLRKRRLERGLSREALTAMSGVPTPTITHFETKHSISLESFVAIAKALGYIEDIKNLLSNPVYNTLEQLDFIHKNKNRKRGRNEFAK